MWTLLLLVAAVWTLFATVGALALGRAIRVADECSPGTGVSGPVRSAALAP